MRLRHLEYCSECFNNRSKVQELNMRLTTDESDSIYVSKDDKITLDGQLCYMVHELQLLNQDALEKLIAIRALKEKISGKYTSTIVR
jgi:hypothetical protein